MNELKKIFIIVFLSSIIGAIIVIPIFLIEKIEKSYLYLLLYLLIIPMVFYLLKRIDLIIGEEK